MVFLHLFTSSLQNRCSYISGLFKRQYNVLIALALQWVIIAIIPHDLLLSDTKTEMPDTTAVDDNNFLVVLFLRP